jgi:hypothetical protein
MKTILLTMTFVISASLSAWGDAIPYPTPGTIAPFVPLTASATGDVDGYFYGFSAGDTDLIEMCDLTASFCSPFGLDNQITPVGTMFDFGAVTAGDVLVFNLENVSAGYTLSSNPAFSVDGINHAYVTPYTATGPTAVAGIPAGTFLGLEDLAVPGSDLDYNDDQFVFTNLRSGVVPEPSLLLLSIGFLGLIPVARRKFQV